MRAFLPARLLDKGYISWMPHEKPVAPEVRGARVRGELKKEDAGGATGGKESPPE